MKQLFKIMKKIKNGTKLIVVFILALIIVCGFYIWKNNIFLKNEPLSYSSKDDIISVSKTEVPFDFTADQLKASASECGVNNDIAYFDKLISKFNGSLKIIYSFKYKKDSQGDGVFTVTVLPNKAGYTSIDQFKKDFDICSVGGDAYPKLVNNNWLLFISSCGSGFDDGSGRVNGCDEVKKNIEPSLKLN